MAEQLEIVIGANVDDAKAGINSLSKTLDDFAKQGKLSIGVIEQSMLQLKATIKATTDPAELQKLNTAFKALQDRLVQLKQQGGLETTLGGVSRSARLAHSDLDQISRDLQLFASGNERAGDALSGLVFTFERLKGTAGGTKAAIASLGEAFLGPAGIVIAISTALNLLGPFVSDLFKASAASKETAENAKKLKDSISGIFEGSAKEATEVLSLIAVLKSETETRERKLEAIKELNKISPETFNNLKLEGDAVRNLDADYQTYLASLKTVIAAKIKQAQLEQLVSELLKKQGTTATGFDAGIQAANKALDENIAKKLKAGEALNSLEQLRLDQSKKEQADIQKLTDQIDVLFKDLQQLSKGIKLDIKTDTAKQGLSEVQKRLIDIAELAQKVFNIPLKLRFDTGDLDVDKFRKAQEILRGIEDHTIRLRIILPDNIELPVLKPRIDEPAFKQEFKDLVKGLTVPLAIVLDQPSLLETEDQIKKIFSQFSDTNIFTQFGHNAGEKFRKALLESLAIFNKGFTINPNIDVTDVINSLTTSLAGIKDIQLKVIKTETFDNAIRTLRDLHDAGVEAGQAVEDAFLKAGKSSDEASRAGKEITKAYGGITKQTEDIARALDSTLTPAFQNLFSSILKGENPLKAFFESIGQSLEQLAAKLISTEVEKAILSLIGVSSGLTTAITATTTATAAAAAAGTAAAGTAAAAAAGAAAAAASASAAAAAAIIAAAAAKAASAAINPLSLLGLIGLGFAEGGEPPVNKPSIVGEKGWEIFIPKVPGTIVSHEDSVNLLTKASMSSSSVKEHETIREYVIANRVSQTIKEYFNTSFTERIRLSLVPIESKISDSVRSITSNNDKLTAYSYKLHEQSSQTIEKIVALTDRTLINRNNESALISNLKERFTSSLTNNNQVSDATEKQSSFTSSTVKEYRDAIKEAVASVATSITDKQFSFERLSAVKESSVADSVKYFTSSSDKERLIKTDFVEKYHDATAKVIASFKEVNKDHSSSVANLVKYFTSSTDHSATASIKESLINNTNSLFKEVSSLINQSKALVIKDTNSNSLVKEYLSFVNKEYDSNHLVLKEKSQSLSKEFISSSKQVISSNFDKVLPYEKPPSIEKSKHYESFFKESLIDNKSSTLSTSLINQIEKLHVNAASFKDSLSSFIKESISSVKNVLVERLKESHSDHSVTIERIINNNNFFSSESFKESFKSMSLTDLQKTFHIPAFATGGAVFGPTLAILGEGFGISRSNPEFVGTASQLKGIQSGVFDVNVNVDGELNFSMGKLAIALNREQRSSFRTSGKKGF